MGKMKKEQRFVLTFYVAVIFSRIMDVVASEFQEDLEECAFCTTCILMNAADSKFELYSNVSRRERVNVF